MFALAQDAWEGAGMQGTGADAFALVDYGDVEMKSRTKTEKAALPPPPPPPVATFLKASSPILAAGDGRAVAVLLRPDGHVAWSSAQVSFAAPGSSTGGEGEEESVLRAAIQSTFFLGEDTGSGPLQ